CYGIFLFFFNDTATTEIYTLSLHDALPIYSHHGAVADHAGFGLARDEFGSRSEEHTSELQSHHDIVCRLLLEKKKKKGFSENAKDRPTPPPTSTRRQRQP